MIPGVFLKDATVNIKNLSPEIRAALPRIRDVLESRKVGPLVITSGNDGTAHTVGSKHYVNDAVDIRSRDIPARRDREAIGREIALALGAKLKLTGGAHVGTDPGYMLYVEEWPVSAPHFHLQVNRRRHARDSRDPHGKWDRATAPGVGGLVITGLGILGVLGFAFALSRR